MTQDEPRSPVAEALAELNPEAVLFDGLDSALIGWASQYPSDPLAVYDEELIIAALEEQGFSPEEARDWYGFNIADLYAGAGTPLILRRVTRE